MNGADRLCDTLLVNGVDVCFANPGTSEMHFVAALDRKPQMRCVLGLFEGVVTGAADGYARMADKPAATLLHCGPGMANALANMHNARRARTPMINVVGDHATYHLEHRRAADQRYREPGPADVAFRPPHRLGRGCRPGDRRRPIAASPLSLPGVDHRDPAGRLRLGQRRAGDAFATTEVPQPKGCRRRTSIRAAAPALRQARQPRRDHADRLGAAREAA